MGSLLVISPHLDDAVFSCGEIIAAHPGAVVATVLAAAPPAFAGTTSWDAASGFDNATQAICARRMEDERALALLSAVPVWLDFHDSQYQASPSLKQLQSALQSIITTHQPDTILLPAGLFHSDHVLVHQAAISLWSRHANKNWLVYEEAHYRRLPGLLQARLSAMAQDGIVMTPIDIAVPGHALLKSQAVHCYHSQLLAFAATGIDNRDLFAPERLWQMTSPDPPTNQHR